MDSGARCRWHPALATHRKKDGSVGSCEIVPDNQSVAIASGAHPLAERPWPVQRSGGAHQMSKHPKNRVRAVARALCLGKLKFYGYHRPVGLIRQSIAEGGPIEQIKTERGRLKMVEAAGKLQTLNELPDLNGAKVNYLSGAKFWYQTLFCFVSLQQNSPFRITPVIHDDGTLDAATRAAIARVVPWAVFIDAATLEDKLDRLLPESRFPSLRARRREYPHLRKLTDIHLGQTDWGLVLDSDILFFRRPDAVLEWFENPRAMYMQDIQNAYGYTPALMQELAGCVVPNKVNVGLYALDRNFIDWNSLEDWCRTQIEREKRNYLQEQGLTALLIAKQKGSPLSASDYVLMPDIDEGFAPKAIMHHYVSQSKRSYFQYGWKLMPFEQN
jgi:hypothetical protein